MMKPEEPHYDDAQVGAILRRAVEIQSGRSDGRSFAGAASGTSLSQLRLAAAELGLSPELIDRAAGELAGERSAESGSRILGGPWNFSIEQIVDGHVGEEDWPLILDDIRKASGRVGSPKTVGPAFEWTATQDDTLHVFITPTPDGRSLVRVMAGAGVWSLVSHLVGGIASSVAAGGLAAGVEAAPLGKALIAAGVLATGFAGARSIVRHIATSRQQTIRNIMSAVLERMASSLAQQPVTRFQAIEPELEQEVRVT